MIVNTRPPRRRPDRLGRHPTPPLPASMYYKQMTTKALIATLRNLKRLKGVRGAGSMTYILEGG